jgi:hypothetical protein
MDADKITLTKGQITFLVWLSRFAVVSGLTLEVEDESLLVRAPHGGQFEVESGDALVHLLTLEADRLSVAITACRNDYGVSVVFAS